MKLIPAALAALTLSAAPASAEEILVNLFSVRYCELRSVGVATNDAINAALAYAVIDAPTPPMGFAGGKPVRSDVIRGVIAVENRCPQYLTR